jgi:hypothetical protein
MGKTGSREQRDLLATSDRVHDVNGRDARLDHLLGVVAARRVDGLTLNVQVVLGHDGRRAIDGLARAVEGAAEHLLRDGHLEHAASELAVRVAVVDAVRALEHLHDSLAALHLEHLSLALLAARERQVDDLGELGQLCRVRPKAHTSSATASSVRPTLPQGRAKARRTLTLSRMTSGPFTPEMVR